MATGLVLDIGCADNWLIPELDNAIHVDTIEQVTSNYVRADAHHLPFKDRSFEVVVMGDILEHVEDPVQCIREAARAAGKICATVPNEHAWGKDKRPFQTATHRRFYTAETIKRDFERAGASPVVRRMDGGGWSFFLVEAVEDPVRPVVENADKIVKALEGTLEKLGVRAIGYYLWQGRARGEQGGDVDIYIEVPPEYEGLTRDLDLVNRTTRERPDIKAHSYMWYCEGLLIDARIGVGKPPEKPYYSLGELYQKAVEAIAVPQDCLEMAGGDERIFGVSIRTYPPFRSGWCFQWMVSCPGATMDTGYYHGFYRGKPERVEYAPRCEILFSVDAHETTHERWGTQPFSSYLRGHINECMGASKGEKQFSKPIHLFPKRFITCQQYYKSDLKPGADFTPIQHRIDVYCLSRLLEEGWIKASTPVYLEDHSHDWKSYICHPFITVEAGKIVEALKRPDGLDRFREYSKYGKEYDDIERAIRCFE